MVLDKAKQVTTKVSSRGQVVLPVSVRASQNWGPGTELVVVERGDEVVLRKRSKREEKYPPITLEEFYRRVPKYEGPYITDEMINEAVLEEARRRWDAKNSS
jgi:AbrB family looped-hinge helix DNA binding protein